VSDVISFLMALIVLMNHIVAVIDIYVEFSPWFYLVLVFNLAMPLLLVSGTIIFFCVDTGKTNISKKDPRFEAVKDDVEKADKRISKISLQLMTGFFYVVAVISLILMAFNFTALDNDVDKYHPEQPKGSFIKSTESCTEAQDFNFFTTGSSTPVLWSTFVNECSCQRDSFYEGKVQDWGLRNYKSVEIWSCRNGQKKLKLREIYRSDGDLEVDGRKYSSGLDLRDFCSPTFKGTSSLACIDVDSSVGAHTKVGQQISKFKMIGISSNTTITGSTEYDRAYLW